MKVRCTMTQKASKGFFSQTAIVKEFKAGKGKEFVQAFKTVVAKAYKTLANPGPYALKVAVETWDNLGVKRGGAQVLVDATCSRGDLVKFERELAMELLAMSDSWALQPETRTR